MQWSLPDKALNIKPYTFEDTASSFIKLDANESFIPIPEHLRKKMAEIALCTDYNRYPDPLSMEAVSAYSNYIKIPQSCITAGNGSDELISLIVGAFLNSGSSLMVAQPDFSMYNFYAGLSEVKCIEIEKLDGVRNDVDMLREAVQQYQPNAVILSNPCSPTGNGLVRADIMDLVDTLSILWIIDEAYMDFWDQSIIKEAISRPNVIVLRTCSKAFGMAALRLGFAICNERLTMALRCVKSPANVNALTDAMAAVVISDHGFVSESIKLVKKNTQRLYANIAKIASKHHLFIVSPTVANFVYIVPRTKKIGTELWEHLKKSGIVIRRLPKGLRITTGTEAENQIVIDAIDRYASVQN